MRPSASRAPIGALAALGAPAAVASLLPDRAGAHSPALWPCPLLHATGVPCPVCGATRAFICLFHGDSAVSHYNWSWLAWWAVAVAGALGLLVRARVRGRCEPLAPLALAGRHPVAAVTVPVAIVATSWAVAVANLHWIASG